MRFVLLIVLLNAILTNAQSISFVAESGESAISITADSKNVSKLIFYVSDLQLETIDGDYLKISDYHLVDFSDLTTREIKADKQNKKAIKSIQFKLGIDSTTNVSGAYGGALDPTKGMYWSWQSGYINFKMEGQIQDENYILHLGGYSTPHKAVQIVKLPVTNQSDEFKITLPLNEIFEKVIPIDHTVMSPSLNAVAMSKAIASFFYLK